jgi:hypothetical protein
VWDTVGSLGIPAIFGDVSPLLYGFLDTSLHLDVLNAYQALSIDERRVEFPPTLWTSESAANQVLQQVWFAGVHCDVGGGYPETGLSDITLSWMVIKAQSLGLEFDGTFLAQYSAIDAKHSLDVAHESWSPKWMFPKSRAIAVDSSISNSVTIRCQLNNAYRPCNVTISNGALADSYETLQIVSPVPNDPAPSQ